MLRCSVVTLILLSVSLALLQPAAAQDAPPPVDATGNIRTSQAPYVQPADHLGRVTGTGFSLQCMVSCPSESIDVMEFREGGSAGTQKLPGRYHAGDVTICCDKKTLKPLFDWFRDLKSGKLANFRQDLVLELLGQGPDGRVITTCKFILHRAWPHQVNWSPNGNACFQLTVEATEMVAQ